MASTPSEFEEREFETPLYDQLCCGNHLVWAPGQVFEGRIGIDHAIFLSDPRLWRFFAPGAPYRGVFLNREDLGFLWVRRRERRPLPIFKLNLFIQAKRSHYHSRRPRHLLKHLSKGGCWRFDVSNAQQEALEKLSAKLGAKAFVCYAAPVFHRLTQLYAHSRQGTIVPNSTFPQVNKLTGHQSFYYKEPGGSGVTNDDPETVEGGGLDEMLRRLVGGVSDAFEGDAATNLKTLGDQVFETMSDGVSSENGRRAAFFEQLRQQEPAIESMEGPRDAVRAYLRVATFASVFFCEWYVVSPGKF